MTERLKRIQGMAKRYNTLGVVKDKTVAAIDAAVSGCPSHDGRSALEVT